MKHSEAYRNLRAEVERIVESCDQTWIENLSDYTYLLEDHEDEIIKNFKDNYSSRSIGLIEFDDIDGDEMVAMLLKTITKQALTALLIDSSECIECDYYVQWNEIASVSIGEMEYQVDVENEPTLKVLMAQCTDEELKEAGIKDPDSFLVYGMPCDRLIWKVDPEILLARVAPYLKRAQLKEVKNV
jgi:hypothetical protein